MSKYFIRTHLSEFVKKIDLLDINPIDSHTLREAMRLYGINMRYLSEIAK